MFDGSTKTFESLSRPDTALVVPILESGMAIFGREEQPGMGPMLRTLGGRVEAGETGEQAAIREMAEESGLTCQKLHLWKAWQPINKIDWAVYLFLAPKAIRAGAQSLDSGEKIELEEIPFRSLFLPELTVAFDDIEFNYALFEARTSSAESTRILSLAGCS